MACGDDLGESLLQGRLHIEDVSEVNKNPSTLYSTFLYSNSGEMIPQIPKKETKYVFVARL